MRTRKKLSRRAAQALVLYGATAVVLLAIAAISVDVGYLAVSHGRVQNAADAASLAALLELWDQRADGQDERDCREAAVDEAAAIVQRNHPGAGMEIYFGVWDGSLFTIVDDTIAANAAAVQSFRTAAAPGGPDRTFFAGAFGVHEVDQWARATARFKQRELVPFAVYEPALVPPGQPLVLYNDSEVAPGNCGLLDFDGGANSASDMKNWTRDGYFGPVYVDPEVGHLIVEGTPGLKSTIKAPIQEHIEEGDEVVSCIYRSVWDEGANSGFEVVGFCTLVVTGITLDQTGDIVDVTAEVVSTYIVGTGETHGSMHNLMRLQLVK